MKTAVKSMPVKLEPLQMQVLHARDQAAARAAKWNVSTMPRSVVIHVCIELV